MIMFIGKISTDFKKKNKGRPDLKRWAAGFPLTRWRRKHRPPGQRL
jgi:hypothetical protein